MFTEDEYRRLHDALLHRVRRVRADHQESVGTRADPDWAEWYGQSLLPDLAALLPGRWTVATIAAELRRAEVEREAQQPGMEPAEYYAEWLLVRTDRGEIP